MKKIIVSTITYLFLSNTIVLAQNCDPTIPTLTKITITEVPDLVKSAVKLKFKTVFDEEPYRCEKYFEFSTGAGGGSYYYLANGTLAKKYIYNEKLEYYEGQKLVKTKIIPVNIQTILKKETKGKFYEIGVAIYEDILSKKVIYNASYFTNGDYANGIVGVWLNTQGIIIGKVIKINATTFEHYDGSGKLIATNKCQSLITGNALVEEFFADFKTYQVSSVNKSVVKENTAYHLRSAKSDKFLEISEGSVDNGGLLIIYHGNGNDNQRFKFVKNGTAANEYFIINKKSGKALSGQGNKGDQIIQWEKDGGERQIWIVEKTGENKVSLKLKYSGMYADVNEGSTEAGAKIWEWDGNGSEAQQWILEN